MARRRQLTASGRATLGLLFLCLAFPAAALATHRGENVVDEVVIRVSYQTSPVPGVTGQVLAHLAMDGGTAIVGADVEFLRQVEFLGPREVTIGHALTDVSGDARLALKPTSQPSWRVIARFAGDEHYDAAEQLAEIVLPSSPTGGGDELTAQNGASLGVIAGVMPGVLTLTALAIWLFLFGLIAVTVLAIRRGRPSAIAATEGRTET